MMASTFIVVTTPSENLHLVIIKYNRCTFFEGVTIKQTIRRPQQQQQQQQQQPHPRPSSVTTAASSPATTRAATSPGRASRPARAAASASPSPAPGTRTSPGAATRRRVMLLPVSVRIMDLGAMTPMEQRSAAAIRHCKSLQ